jgi:alkylation response protein AidB-like acyl-CoA dehydrogenase
VGALEKKMGIHGQPTCVMNYDSAVGWLVGEANRGLAAMFTMMNAERLMVGIQGLGLAGGAYQQAAAYARERLQGAAPMASADRSPSSSMPMCAACCWACAVSSRRAALAGWTALHLDRAHRHPDAAERARSDALVALLTPVIKAGFTDLGFEGHGSGTAGLWRPWLHP